MNYREYINSIKGGNAADTQGYYYRGYAADRRGQSSQSADAGIPYTYNDYKKYMMAANEAENRLEEKIVKLSGQLKSEQEANAKQKAEEYAREATKGDGFEEYSLDELKKMFDEETVLYTGGEAGPSYGYGGNFMTRALDWLGATDKWEADEQKRRYYKKLKAAYENRNAAYTNYMTSFEYGTNNADEAIDLLKSQKKYASDEQREEIDKEIEDIKDNLYGDGTWLSYAGKSVKNGWNQILYGLASSGDFVLGNIARAFGLEKIGKIYSDNKQYFKEIADNSQREMQRDAYAAGDKNVIAGTVISGVTENLPDMILAVMTAGASAPASLSKMGASSASLAETFRTSVSAMAKNPAYWSSFTKELGTNYDEALENGANQDEAMLFTLFASALNSAVEVGGATGAGGFQSLPEDLIRAAKSGKSALWEWFKSSLEEGGEEVVQGIISNLTAKAVYDSDRALYSTDDQDAVINPQRMAQEFGYGTAIGGILGGGQTAVNIAANADINKRYKNLGKLMRSTKDFDIGGIIDYAKKSGNTEIRTAALRTDPKKINDRNAGMLYSYVFKDIHDEIYSPENINTVNDNFNRIMDSNPSKTIQDIASSQYVLRLMEKGIDFESARYMAGATPPSTDAAETAGGEVFGPGEETTSGADISAPSADVRPEVITLKSDNKIRRHLNKAEQDYVKKVAGAFGVNVIFENVKDVTGISGDSYYDSLGNIHMDYSVTDPINILIKHELTHFGEDGKLYYNFVRAVKESNSYKKWLDRQISGNKSTAAKAAEYRNNIIKRYEVAGKKLSPEGADAEMIANFAADNLFTEDGAGLDTLIKQADAKDRHVIIQWIIDFINSIKSLFKGNYIPPEISRLERKYTEMLKSAEKALSDIMQKNTAENGGEKFSVSSAYDYSKTFAEQIDDWKAGKTPEYDTLLVGGTPDVLQKVGLNALPITINTAHVKDALSFNAKHPDRNIGENLLKQIPEALENPVAIIASKTHSDTSVVVLLKLQSEDGRPIIAPIVIDGYGRQNGLRIDSNAVASVHNRNNAITKLLSEAIREEQNGNIAIYYYNKKIANPLLQGVGLQLPDGLIPHGGYIHSIRENSSPVKNKLKNATYSQQFKRWFGKSKVVDENGEPLIVYHGTGSDFNIFKSTDGVYWFSQSKDYAEAMAEERGGSRIIEAYLSISNPFYASLAPEQFSNPAFEASIIKKAKAEGYDGVIIENATDDDLAYDKFYVVFKPSQIKSATDNIGTFDGNNPDIRFSIPDDQSALLDRYDRGEISRQEYLEESNKNWQRAVEEYGTIPEGEKAVEKIPVPKAVENKRKTGRFVRTITEGGALTERMVEEMGAKILLGDFSYDPVSDKEATKYADETAEKGQAEKRWQKAVFNSKVISKNEIAIGEKLLLDAVKAKDTKRVLEISAELTDVLTRAGQVVQAARMLKNMTGAGKLLSVQRFIDSINRDLERKYKKNAPVVKLDPLIAEQLAGVPQGAFAENAYREAVQDIAAQVPSTFLDKWNAWRYMAMLVNPTTHIRNIVGNAVFLPSVRMKDVTAALLERAFVSEEERTKVVAVKREYRDYAKADAEKSDVINALKSGGKFNSENQVSEQRRIFKNRALEFMRTFNSNLLENEDLLFKNSHYIHALAGFLQARNIDLKNVDEKTLWQARIYAVNEAMKATFNDVNKISTALSAAARSSEILDIAINGILPFKKTPVNIIRRGVEYSPIGLISALTKGSYDLKNGKISATEYIDGLGAGISGSVVFGIGMLLASLGYVTGGLGDDDEDKFRKLNGEQEYALNLFGKSYTIDWAAPSSIPFFVGVELMNTLRDDDEGFSLSDISDTAWNSLEPIVNLSMLSGVQSMIESVKYAAEDKSVLSLAGNIAKSYVSQAFPSVFGKLARTLDDTRRSNYIDKNSQLSEYAQSFLNTMKSKIPGLEATRPEYINEWGQPESNGNVAERIFSNFVSPGYYSEVEYDSVNTEIYRIASVTGNDAVYPNYAQKSFSVNGKTKYLIADEYVKYAKAKGQYSYDYLKEFFNMSAYQSLTDEERADVIENLYKYANAKAKTEVSDYDITKSFKTVSQWEKSGRSPVLYYISLAIKK